MVDLTERVLIGDCPKCGKRTFLVYEKSGDLIRQGDDIVETKLKGQCYNCGWVKKFSY